MKTSKKLIGLAGSVMLSVSALAPAAVTSTPTVVQAAKSTYGKKIKLIRKAYIYNKKGHKTHKKALKKGKTYVLKGTKRIHGKKYYVLSKKRYIKASKAKLLKNLSSTKGSVMQTDDTSSMTTTSSSSNKHKKPTIDNSNNSTNSSSEGGWDDVILGTNITDRDTFTFEPKDLAKIQTALWQKVQNARIAAGLSPYKQSAELDAFVKNWTENDASIENFTDQRLSVEDIRKGVPSLSQKIIGLNEYTFGDCADSLNTGVHIDNNFDILNANTDIVAKKSNYAYASIAVTYNKRVQAEQQGAGYQYSFVAVYSDDPSF